MKKLNNKKGFTLAELLIVVAIIAVLVAISIPIFAAQLEKAREAVDEANIRDAYAVCIASALSEAPAADVTKNNTDKITYTVTGTGNEYTVKAQIKATQSEAGWKSASSTTAPISIGGKSVDPSTTGWTVTVGVSGEPTIAEGLS